MRCFALKQKSQFQHVTDKIQDAEMGGERTLCRCDGMGRDLPAVRAALGPEHRRLSAAILSYRHYAIKIRQFRQYILPSILSGTGTGYPGTGCRVHASRYSRVTARSLLSLVNVVKKPETLEVT